MIKQVTELSRKEKFIQEQMGKSLSFDLDQVKAERERLEKLWDEMEAKVKNSK